MRHAAIALLFCTLTATAAPAAPQQVTAECNPKGLWQQGKGIVRSADINDALLEKELGPCSQKELQRVIMVLMLQSNVYLAEYGKLVKNFNTLLRLSSDLVSSAEAAIKEMDELHKENRALQMGQELLLRMQRFRNAMPASPPTRRELTCKTTTIGMFKTTKCIEE